MSTQSYSTTFTVEQTPSEVFDAINNVRGWWSGKIEGNTKKLGDEFKYNYQDFHHSTQKITEFVPDKKVVWHVTDASLSSFQKKAEWIGTDIIFEIADKDGKTEVRFTHKGLVPQFQCYGDCSGAWGTLLNVNLRNLIITGKDQSDVFST